MAREKRITIEYEPFGSQAKFHELRCTAKGFSGPIGSGKSQALCVEAISLAFKNRGLPGLIGGPTYRFVEDSTKQSFLEILEYNEIAHRQLKSENAVILEDVGSKVLFRSLEEPEKLRGTNLAWIGVDELTYCKEASWQRLQGRVRHPKASELARFAVWTPNGYDWVYRMFRGPDRVLGYEAIYAKPFENRAILQNDPQFYERLKDSYPEKFYRQEVLGEYLNLGAGQVYYAFDRDVHVDDVKYNPLKPIYWALDFNVDPMSSVICQLEETSQMGLILTGERIQRINVIDELFLPNSNTWEACEEFWKKVSSWTKSRPIEVMLYGDAAGNSRQTTGLSDWKMVMSWMAAHGADVKASKYVPEGNPPVKSRVNAVNSMLRSMSGLTRIAIHPRCKRLQRDLEEVTWKVDGSNNPTGDIDKSKNPDLTHISDALGYLVHKLYGYLLHDTSKPLI